MFDYIQKNKRLAQVVLALLMIPFAFFGLESYTGSMGARDDVATVDGVGIAQREFAEELREQQERLRAAFGRGVDPAAFDTPEARRALLEQMVSRRLVADAAMRAHLAVSDASLREAIAGIPAFQSDGAFSKAQYEALLRAQGMTPRTFEARMRYDLSLAQLTRAIAETAIVSRTVTERSGALLEQRREVAEALIPAQAYLAQVKVTEVQAKAYYDANPAEFRIPERVRAEYLLLSAEALGRQAEVPEAELKAAYEARAAQYRVEEQRRASHLLVKTREEADKLAAEARRSPARFAELAKRHSQDPGSAAKGGDLGFFGRGMMVPAFEQAAFRQKEGEIGDPVQSDFGWHVIRVTGVQPAKARSFQEVRAELAADLGRQLGARRFAEAAEAFSNTVYEQSDSLKPAAERFKLPLQASGWIARTPAPEAGMLANAKLLGALFAEDSIKSRRNTDAVEVAPGVLAAARVLEHQPQSQRKFEEVRAPIEQRLRAAEAARLAQKEGEARLAELRKGGAVAGLQWGAPKALSRRSPQAVPAGALRQIMSADPARLPAHVGAERGTEGYVLYRVTRVLEPAARPEPQRAGELERAAQAAGAQQLEAYVASLRANAKVEVHAANLEKKP
jgi:peptidyl-prolyl cis-trans isomerase D